MNITVTLFAQTITFFVFVLLCMKYVWPPIMNALHVRQTKIADGLAAAERGQLDKQLASKHAAEELRDAKEKASEIIAKAEKRASASYEKDIQNRYSSV